MPTGETIGFAPEALLCPATPSKILCVGRNYRAHAKELGNDVPAEPMLFFKPPSSLIGPGESVVLPSPSITLRVEHEAELCLVIGRELRGATHDEALAGIFGWTAACDVTARDLQKKDGQWWRAKGSDTFCPVGPMIAVGLPAADISIECLVNGERRQQGCADQMIFGLGEVLSFISRSMTLLPGDLVLTGTPEGVGPLRGGDELTIAVGTLEPLVVGVRNSP